MTNVRITPTDNGPYQPSIHRPVKRLDLTPEAAIALVESFMEDVWAARNPSAVDRFVTEDFVITSAGVDVAGRENFKAWVAGFQSKIADLKWEPIETFANADGSRVSSRFRVTAATTACSGCRRMVSRSR
jgi:SnoaL-like domain